MGDKPKKPRKKRLSKYDFSNKPKPKVNYQGPAYQQGNVYDKPSLKMTLYGGTVDTTRLIGRLSPPIASSIEDLIKYAEVSKTQIREYSQKLIDTLKGYIASEDSLKPYTDGEIASHLILQGYEVTRREVSGLRHFLSIQPSYKRQKSN